MARNRIRVRASAARRAPPEHATWSLQVVVTGDEPQGAFDRCAERANAVLERLRDVATVHTGPISVQPVHYGSGGDRVRHEASAEVVARAPIERAGEVAGAAMRAGADQLTGPALAVADREALRSDALADAVASARRCAERIAAAAGRTAGRVVSVDADEDAHYEGAVMAYAASGGPDDVDPPVEPGDVAVTAHVRVVVELTD
jgi:uncharacterized protein